MKGEKKMSPSEQRVRLYYIDKFWAEHLAYVSYIRESIHLTSLANRYPLNDFHDQIIHAFEQIPAEIDRETANMLAKLEGSNDPAQWEQFGLESPSSTRTYMINDQYMDYLQNRSSWAPGTVLALWLRQMLKPVFRWQKF